MSARQRVGIYARISQDRDGTGAGVRRQLEDCRSEARRRGWTVAEEYIDDDYSAYAGKPRPAYSRMLADIAAGRLDAIIVWHVDRLHRRPIELEQFAATCQAASVSDVVTLHGDFDLGSGDGLLIARLLSAVAANESDAKRRRGRRKMRELAEAGAPHGGGTRPFGFASDKVTHVSDEAEIIRTLAARALAGESITSLARWLDSENVRTVTGKPWRPQVLRQLLLNPRIFGMRHHNGEAVAEAQWEPIISPSQGERLRLLLTDPSRRTNRTARTYLLSGMCRCSKCGHKLLSVPRHGVRRYLCRASVGFDGCGGIAISAKPLEAWIADAVLYRLDTPALEATINGRVDTEQTQALAASAQLLADEARLAEVDAMFADGEIDRVSRRRMADQLQARIADGRSALAAANKTEALADLFGQGRELRQRWDTLTMERQRSVLSALVDHVVVHPASRTGTHGLDPSRVEAVWRA